MSLELIKALGFYNLKNPDAELIRHYDDSVYKIKTQKTYALKICSPKTTQKRLQVEVNWLTALKDTNLIVPKPVANKQGDLISHLEDRCCVLFEWLSGEPVSQIMSQQVAKQVGEMMATLHLQASNYYSDRQAAECYDSNYFFVQIPGGKPKPKNV